MKCKKIFLLTLAIGSLFTATLSGCKSSSPSIDDSTQTSQQAKDDAEQPVTLRWYLPGPGPQADVDAVEQAVHEYLMDEYEMNIDLQLIMNDFASYPEKMQMIISSGEEYDICWTSDWNNNYYDNINKNAFLELDELLETYAPELLSSMSPDIWEGVTVKGNIYGIPNQQIFPKQNYVAVLSEYVEKYNLDTASVDSLEDLEDFFLQVKADNPDMYPLAVSSMGILGKFYLALDYQPLAGVYIPGALQISSGELKVVNQYKDIDKVIDFFDMMHRWVNEGIVRQDAMVVTDDAVPDMKAGKHVAAVYPTYSPGSKASASNNFGGKDVELILMSDSYIGTDSCVATMNAISRTSKNPEIAMQFLNLVNTDPDLYNLLILGIEGVHYTTNEDGTVTSNDSAGYNPNTDWMFGNQFNAKVREGEPLDIWEQTKAINESDTVVTSIAMGFSFDSTTVTNELAAVTAAVEQYRLSLETGAADPATVLPEFYQKMEDAGSEKIIAEVQRQLDEWAAQK